MAKIKPFINRYRWKGINYPSAKDDWKMFEKNNLSIAHYKVYAKKLAYISKHNVNHEKKLFLLMIPN